jgi:hypothetical protein
MPRYREPLKCVLVKTWKGEFRIPTYSPLKKLTNLESKENNRANGLHVLHIADIF